MPLSTTQYQRAGEEASSRVRDVAMTFWSSFSQKIADRFIVGDGVTMIGGRAGASSERKSAGDLNQHCTVVVEDAAGRRHWEKHGSIGSERIPSTSLGGGK